jgi:hypothetical protein
VLSPVRHQGSCNCHAYGADWSRLSFRIPQFLLKEFCIVCFSFHTCNFSMLILSALEYRDPEVKAKKTDKAIE